MWFWRNSSTVDRKVKRQYRRYADLAAKFGFTFSRCRLSTGGNPNVLLLGNHSSGKSTWINFLLGGDQIQDTGVAPTDDGFTVITNSASPHDFMGPAAIRALPRDFSIVEKLGPNFMRRFKVKQRPRGLLRKINLIDSPGMIDAARGDIRRDYDFIEAVRRIAEISDLVLFFFDPDKPGTTAESLLVIHKALPGMHYKLRFIMNKADTFENMHDFARAYGALCWNLARVLETKDLPMVHTTYAPTGHEPSRPRLEMSDFDRCRDALLGEIVRAGERRVDNIVALIRQDLSRLALHVRVCLRVRRMLLARRSRNVLVGLGIVAGTGLVAFLAANLAAGPIWSRWVSGAIASVLALLAVWRVYSADYDRFREATITGQNLDLVMQSVCRRELAAGSRDDLRQGWREIRQHTLTVLDRLAEKLPIAEYRLSRLEEWLENESASL